LMAFALPRQALRFHVFLVGNHTLEHVPPILSAASIPSDE